MQVLKQVHPDTGVSAKAVPKGEKKKKKGKRKESYAIYIYKVCVEIIFALTFFSLRC